MASRDAARARWRAARCAFVAHVAIYGACVGVASAVAPFARDALSKRIELSAATDAVRKTLEGAHAARALGASAYDGSAFHGHPWTVAAAGALGGGFGLDLATTAADALAAAALCALACGVTRDEGKVRRVYAMYAMNPLHAMARLARTTATATRACAYASALAATLGNDVVAGVAFALAAQLNPHYVALAPALMWTSARAVKSRGGRAVVSAGRFAGAFAVAAAASFVAMGDDFPKWWRAAVTFAVMSEDQTPNLGLHWYLFTTMFDQFRLFYVVALNAIPLALSAPLTLGFADDPLVAMTLCLIAISTCAPYPTANDFVTYVSLLSVVAMDDRGNPLVYVKYGAVIAGGFLYVALLSPLTWYMWIHTRVANANFYYAITLVYACTQTLLSTQVARSVARFRRAGMKRD